MPAVRKLGAAELSVKSANRLLGGAMLHKLADSQDRGASFLEHRGEDVPRVNHVGPHLELDVDTRRSCGFGALKVVIQEGFRGSDLNQQGWEARHVGMERRH